MTRHGTRKAEPRTPRAPRSPIVPAAVRAAPDLRRSSCAVCVWQARELKNAGLKPALVFTLKELRTELTVHELTYEEGYLISDLREGGILAVARAQLALIRGQPEKTLEVLAGHKFVHLCLSSHHFSCIRSKANSHTDV